MMEVNKNMDEVLRMPFENVKDTENKSYQL